MDPNTPEEIGAQARVSGRVPGVPKPAANLLTIDDVFDSENLARVEVLHDHFNQEGRLTIEAALKLIQLGEKALAREPTMLMVTTPLTICGDTHGQWFDLMTLFKLGGPPGESTKYLFLGDYVDRGCFSAEIVLYLYALKVIGCLNFQYQ